MLLRQYIRLGARVFDFSLDPDFGNAIDAFVVLDLECAPRELLARYFGQQGLTRYFDRRTIEQSTYAILHAPG